MKLVKTVNKNVKKEVKTRNFSKIPSKNGNCTSKQREKKSLREINMRFYQKCVIQREKNPKKSEFHRNETQITQI